MDAHERIFTCLSHEEPDRIPTFVQHLEPPFIKAYDEQIELKSDYGYKGGFDLMVATELGLDSKWNHGAGVGPRSSKDMPDVPDDVLKEATKGLEHYSINSDGSLSARNSAGEGWYQDGLLYTPDLIKDWISFIKSFVPSDEATLEHLVEDVWKVGLNNDIVFIPTAGGPVYTTWSSIGLKHFAYVTRKYMPLVKQLINAWKDKTIEIHNILFEHGMDMVFTCDDHAFKGHQIFRPELWDELVLPVYTEIAANAHEHGARYCVHTDGNLMDEIAGLIKAGVDGVDPLEYEAGNRLGPLKEQFGTNICFIGNVPSSDVLSFGTVEDTIKITKQQMLEAGEGGSYICAPGSDVLGTIKPENLQAMIATVKKYGKYPLDKEILA
ncbi:MAG TPA: uroporphyrinogen decarboxylase family protein [Candidatus Lokiarchaeia archaeon]|nr:uroporphyrinogen decarboxylase family protein [Candidatus Lokiarchaeia archaeon]